MSQVLLGRIHPACLLNVLAASMVKSVQKLRKPLGIREVEIIRRLKEKLKLPITKIALAVGRDKTTVYKALRRKFKPQKRGRPAALTRADVNLLVRTIRAMVFKADARYEVTLAMAMRRAKLKCGERCARKALKSGSIKFLRMRSKPILTRQDVKERYAFAKKYRNKPKSFWLKHVDFYWDLKSWAVHINARGRAHAAQREVRGAYRLPSQGLCSAYVVAGCRVLRLRGAPPTSWQFSGNSWLHPS